MMETVLEHRWPSTALRVIVIPQHSPFILRVGIRKYRNLIGFYVGKGWKFTEDCMNV